MRKDIKVLYNKEKIQSAINKLDKNKIHIIYLSYYCNFHNIYRNPLLLGTKLLNFFSGKPSIDHITHISRFIFDEEANNWICKVFEATMARGMEENDLFEKLKNFQGVCYLETLNKDVDKKKAKEFEKKYTGVPYSKKLAILSGVDIDEVDSVMQPKNNGGFCSWLEALFLMDQGYNLSFIEKGNPLEMTPTDIFLAGLGTKQILYKF